MEYFDLNEEHIKLLHRANVGWGGAYEGAPVIDSKRPFGNSDVISDIARIIGIEEIEGDDEFMWPRGTHDRCMTVYRELEKALQVVLAAGSFETGRYEVDEYHRNWRPMNKLKVT